MRVTKEQARQNHDRALAAAAGLFRERGFDAVGVAELMRAAGLTHGGFYNHFQSKEAIEAEACANIFAGSVRRLEKVAAIKDEAERRDAFDAYRRRYVSPANRDAPAPACPMVAFAGDIPHRAEPARKAFADGLAAYLEAFTRAASLEGEVSRAEAIRTFATLFGALSLARSIASEKPELSDEILAAAAAAVH